MVMAGHAGRVVELEKVAIQRDKRFLVRIVAVLGSVALLGAVVIGYSSTVDVRGCAGRLAGESDASVEPSP
jgi:hypothetical protein